MEAEGGRLNSMRATTVREIVPRGGDRMYVRDSSTVS